MRLNEAPAGIPLVVINIAGGRGVRRQLNALGIHVGDVIKVVDRAPFRGPVLVEVHGMRVALGRGVAAKLLVRQNESSPGGSA